jgi:hypothetical protein
MIKIVPECVQDVSKRFRSMAGKRYRLHISAVQEFRIDDRDVRGSLIAG